jgi:hypothetical protein
MDQDLDTWLWAHKVQTLGETVLFTEDRPGRLDTLP